MEIKHPSTTVSNSPSLADNLTTENLPAAEVNCLDNDMLFTCFSELSVKRKAT